MAFTVHAMGTSRGSSTGPKLAQQSSRDTIHVECPGKCCRSGLCQRFRTCKSPFVLLPFLAFCETASAHNPLAMYFAGLSVFATAALLAAFLKTFVVCYALNMTEEAKAIGALGVEARIWGFLAVAGKELAIMLVAFCLSFWLTSNRHAFVLLFVTCVVYLTIAPFPNYAILQRLRTLAGMDYHKKKVLKYAVLFSLIFPVFMWVLVLTSLQGLYDFLTG